MLAIMNIIMYKLYIIFIILYVFPDHSDDGSIVTVLLKTYIELLTKSLWYEAGPFILSLLIITNHSGLFMINIVYLSSYFKCISGQMN